MERFFSFFAYGARKLDDFFFISIALNDLNFVLKLRKFAKITDLKLLVQKANFIG